MVNTNVQKNVFVSVFGGSLLVALRCKWRSISLSFIVDWFSWATAIVIINLGSKWVTKIRCRTRVYTYVRRRRVPSYMEKSNGFFSSFVGRLRARHQLQLLSHITSRVTPRVFFFSSFIIFYSICVFVAVTPGWSPHRFPEEKKKTFASTRVDYEVMCR